MLAGCTGSIRIANCYEQQNHNKVLPASDDNCLIGGREGEKGGQGNVDENERPALL